MKYLFALIVTPWLIACGSNTPLVARIETKESFQQIKSQKAADYLFVIDTSASMAPYVQRMSANISRFTQLLKDSKIDFRMGITNMTLSAQGESKKLMGNTILSTTDLPQIDSKITSMLNELGAGQILSPMSETGLHAALSLLKLDGSATNTAWLRSNARLVIIFISDSNDESYNCTQKYGQSTSCSKYFLSDFPEDIQPYRDQFLSLKGQPDLLKIKAIISKTGKPCPNNTAAPESLGDRYMNLIQTLGGSVSSDAIDICQDWGETLSQLAQDLYPLLKKFKLSKIPASPTQIRVKVNGVEVPQDLQNGFQYLASSNEIQFNGSSIPDSEASIEMSFEPQDR